VRRPPKYSGRARRLRISRDSAGYRGRRGSRRVPCSPPGGQLVRGCGFADLMGKRACIRVLRSCPSRRHRRCPLQSWPRRTRGFGAGRTADALSVQLDSRLAELEEWVARVAELEARLGQYSSNYSKPHLSDPPSKQSPTSSPWKSASVGQPGVTLARVAGPQHMVVHEPPSCSGCEAEPAGVWRSGGRVARCSTFQAGP
jgi:hypothetical protein